MGTYDTRGGSAAFPEMNEPQIFDEEDEVLGFLEDAGVASTVSQLSVVFASAWQLLKRQKVKGAQCLIGRGIGVHWPALDEDIAVGTLLKN